MSHKIFEYLKIKCEASKINDNDFYKYFKFMLPLCLGFKIAILAGAKTSNDLTAKINEAVNNFNKGESLHMFDVWSIARFCSGILVQNLCYDDNDALLAHLAFECFESCEIFKSLGNILPSYVQSELQMDTYEGDSLENVCGDFIAFYAGCVLSKKIYSK
jgi:hypothetical protein